MTRLTEDCAAFLDSAQSAGAKQWTWVLDFQGFGMWDSDPSTILKAVPFLQTHPFRLYRVVLLDAPTLFNATWRLASTHLSEVTKAKAVFTSIDGLRSAMEPWAGAEARAREHRQG